MNSLLIMYTCMTSVRYSFSKYATDIDTVWAINREIRATRVPKCHKMFPNDTDWHLGNKLSVVTMHMYVLQARTCTQYALFMLHVHVHVKSFIAKRVNSILVNLRYLRFKLLKYKENNKKICNTFDRNFKNIP